MNLDCEYKELVQLANREQNKPISLTMSPALLVDIDRVCKELRFSRGELLSVCFLRVKNSYERVLEDGSIEPRLTKKDKARIEIPDTVMESEDKWF